MSKKKSNKRVSKYIQSTPKPVFVAQTSKMGRGVFANKDFKKNEIIVATPLLRLSPGDQHFIEKTTLQYYVYGSPSPFSGDSYLALGEGSLFNNDDYSANTGYEIDEQELLIVFKAERDIKAGEELFVNYGWDL